MRMNFVKEKEINDWIILVAILLFAFGLRLVFFIGLSGEGYDDLAYAFRAYRFTLEDFFPAGANPWSTRLAMVAPVALFLKLFGVKEFNFVVFPLLCSVGNIILFYYFGKLLFNHKVALLSSLLISFFPLDIFLATVLLPDGPVVFFMGLSVFFFLTGEKNHKCRYYLLSGISLGFAYLTRMTGLYILLFFLSYIFFVKKRINPKFGLILLAFLMIFALETFYFFSQTGDPTYRFSTTGKKVVQDVENRKNLNFQETDETFFKNKEAFSVRTPIIRGNNWLIEPLFTLTTSQEFGFFYYLIIPVTLFYLFRKRQEQVLILLLWMIPLFLYTAYGSTHPFHFTPLRRWPRYFNAVTIPSLLILAHFLYSKRHWLKNRFAYLMVAFLFVSSLTSLWSENSNTDTFIIKRLSAFYSNHQNASFMMSRYSYNRLAPFVQYKKDRISLFDVSDNIRNIVSNKTSVFYNMKFVNVSEADNSYIILTSKDVIQPLEHWELIQTYDRPKKLYCLLLESHFFRKVIPKYLLEKLCINEVGCIYSAGKHDI